jgi:hypothetical protein
MTSKNVSNGKSHVDITVEKYGTNKNTFLWNVDSSLVVCIAYKTIKEKTLEQKSMTYFFVYDKINQKPLFEDKVEKGSVEWIDKYQIKVNVPNLTMNQQKNYSYIYDIKLSQKKELGTYQK